MGDVSFISPTARDLAKANLPGHNFKQGDGDGGDGGDGMLEKRVKQLEDDLTAIKIDVAVIRSNYATVSDIASVKTEVANAKADMHSAMRLQAITIIGSVLAAVGTGVGLIIKMMPH